MNIHKYDNNMRSDDEFINGDLSFLVESNRCRLLDGRRTTGIIERYFEDSAMFRWRITKYEDKGKYWDLPAEDITKFQFEKDSNKLSNEKLQQIEKMIKKYDKRIEIEAKKCNLNETEKEIEKAKSSIVIWLKENSLFFNKGEQIDFSSSEGSKSLALDLKKYMESVGLEEEENKTTETIVLNPNSGEWIKGMSIVLADMGIVPFIGKTPRTNDVFKGIGSKENRRKYLINRLAFIRAYFSMLNIKEVVLYRGMSSEKLWKSVDRTYLHCTFNIDVANAFCNFERDSKYKISYLVRMTYPVEKLFITYFETEAMNRQYKEAEALVLYDEIISI